MADGHGCIPVQKHACNRLSNQKAPSNYYSPLTLNNCIMRFEHADNAFWGAGCKSFIAINQLADIHRTKAIDVLFGKDGIPDGALVDLAWQGELHQNGMHALILVEFSDKPKQITLGCAFGQFEFFGIDPYFPRLLFLGTHIRLGSGVIANKDDGKGGHYLPGAKLNYLRL